MKIDQSLWASSCFARSEKAIQKLRNHQDIDDEELKWLYNLCCFNLDTKSKYERNGSARIIKLLSQRYLDKLDLILVLHQKVLANSKLNEADWLLIYNGLLLFRHYLLGLKSSY